MKKPTKRTPPKVERKRTVKARALASLPFCNIETALTDPQLLGAALGDPVSWSAWIAVLKATFGNKLTEEELEGFRAVAGGREPPPGRVRELWAIVGRRGGKSRIAAAVAVFLACFVDHSAKLAQGETGFVLVLAPTQKQAKLILDYVRAFIEASAVLAQQIVAVTAEEIRLKGNITISVHPASFRSVRGRTLVACIFDEASFWRDETSAEPDLEIYRAVLPSLASASGMLIGISSPYRKVGLLHTKHRDHFGVEGDVLVVQAGSTTFNPMLDERVIAAARASDPAAALAEWDAEFRNDLSSLFDDAVIDAAVERGRPAELPPRKNAKYFAFTDPSGGRHDHFTVTVAHLENEIIIVDALRGVAPPFNPESVAAEFAKLLKSYGLREVTGDNFAQEWVVGAFAKVGIKYKRADLNRSEIYLECLPLFARNAVRLPDQSRMIRELRLLERKVHRSGRDSVDHPRGGSDDYANAACGALWLVAQVKKGGTVHVGYSSGAGAVTWDHDTPKHRELVIRDYTQAEANAMRERGEW